MIKLMGIVTEKPKVNEVIDTTEIIKKIAKLTDRNDHTASVIELATFLNNTKALKLLQAIETIHDIEGSMPTEISKYRSSILKDLMDKFKSKYGQDAAKELNGAF
jgi:5,10-methylene-tetrahydrofolate dehydrogenase/methenyl tetrahydrofolate cyclohydrolase